ncbi:phenylacetic acid degradation bifunctional protein PaaZ [Acetobacter tropicalis]|uniref:Aldehyde/L-sorbosone dehydrogenase n=1 Tax=Acetobacter tropicalis NBRC 101654 TaxID=749388 RepID=F7VAG6_9PROT|nr:MULTISPECIES: phenylacetic acid degradation bifunctional protein PaaZ [Acetobacter]MCG4254042.1 phenylacetic acid degradation bifunctional protein PaaZ [Acetobacter senegalensis]MCP1194328.1 phenylacetic acid degradation bifunctional protein PaaZ [Acetobacter senegalensis]GAA07361.1 aldehyde/L-sorbosone dehydrogenase [Acetobacter tropicalis NBRC 101654]
MTPILASYAQDRWHKAVSEFEDIQSAVNGQIIAQASSSGLDFGGLVQHARSKGGPALRKLNFHQRADMIKKLALYLTERKQTLYDLSFNTGATSRDNLFDIDGGIGTLFAYASMAKKNLPDKYILAEEIETLSRNGTFMGTHILSSLQGVAVHINAYNFPCWGMLEKLAPAIIAGVPVITKPATVTSYVAHAVAQMIVDSGIFPPGAFQFICGRTGDLLDHLKGQDVLSFTGSITTSEKLRNHPIISANAVRFIAERDSLNAAVLGPDVSPDMPEFDLFIRAVTQEMTVKAGQKCTAIRRIMVPETIIAEVTTELKARLDRIVVGDPQHEGVTMGPLAGLAQREDVRRHVATLAQESEIVFGDPQHCDPLGASDQNGAFMSPVLLQNLNPHDAISLHHTEAFGPVATIMPYTSLADAASLVKRGEGSLVATLCTYDDNVAAELVASLASFHGRLHILDRECAKESTGHGSPLPALVHGGPGRAGGGEELGGIRGIRHYMQRTALQASPTRLTRLTGRWTIGAQEALRKEHPFRYNFAQLTVGDTIHTQPRTITVQDIEHFAEFTGDTFYAHTDEKAAAANPFFPGRVAHGYLLLSFAAGLFVDPAPGPLLANYGLESLRFLKPVSPGDAIQVRLTVKSKNAAREPHYGEVRWDVELFNQNKETVARYDLLTMSAQPAAA